MDDLGRDLFSLSLSQSSAIVSTPRAYQCFHLSSILLTNAVAWCCVFGKNDGDVLEAVALGKMLLIEVRSLITPAVLPVAPSCFARAVRKNERGLFELTWN